MTPTPSGAYADYAPDGTTQTIATVGYTESYLVSAGQRYRFNGDAAGTATDVDCYVEGEHIRLQSET